MNESTPTPNDLKNRFIIPWELAEQMAPWFGLSESMIYKIVRGKKKPSRRTQNQLNERLGIPTQIWNKNLDELAEYLYTCWYENQNEEPPEKPTKDQLEELWNLF